jgi:hypothetical protein
LGFYTAEAQRAQRWGKGFYKILLASVYSVLLSLKILPAGGNLVEKRLGISPRRHRGHRGEKVFKISPLPSAYSVSLR